MRHRETLVTFVLIALAGCGGPPAPAADSTPSKAGAAPSTPGGSAAAAKDGAKPAPAEDAAAVQARELAEKWAYKATQDAMTSRQSRTASIASENTVNFSFPYQGDQHATLILRDHPSHGKDVIFTIEQGQLLCQSYQDCQIRVRFDDGQPVGWSAVGSSDNNSTIIFLRNDVKFLQRLRSSKVVRIQVPVYQEGQPIFEFQVGGFDHERYSKGS
jgi:hypothetical protein